MAPGQVSPDQTVRRSRRAILAGLLVTAGLLAAAAVHWASPWGLARGEARGAGYALSSVWDGAGAPSGRLKRPIGVSVGSGGDVFVTDAKRRIVRFAPSGEVRAEWVPERDGKPLLGNPVGIAIAPDGSAFVSDYEEDRILKLAPEGHLLLEMGRRGAALGELNAPAGLALAPDGSLLVADFYNGRLQRFLAEGAFRDVIGHPGRLRGGALHYPTGVFADPGGHLLVADAYNHQIQEMSPDGRPVRRLGFHLLWLWPLAAASHRGLRVPSGVVAGPDGVIHVADSGNHRVVMLSGHGEFLVDWVISDADPNIYSPEQVAVSSDGKTLYATDLGRNRLLVLAIRPPLERKRP